MNLSYRAFKWALTMTLAASQVYAVGSPGPTPASSAREPSSPAQTLWSRVEANPDSPGMLLTRVRKAMAGLVREGRYAAVDSLAQEARVRFPTDHKPLFFFALERILLDYLEGNPKAWADPIALDRALDDAHVGFIAPHRDPAGDPEASLGSELVKAARDHLPAAEDGIYDQSLSREQQDFLLLVLHDLIRDGSDAKYGIVSVVNECERFRKAYGDDGYVRFALRNFPHELRPTLGGLGMGFGFGSVSLDQPASGRIGDPSLFAWDITWYEGPIAFTAAAHFIWGMRAAQAFTYHGEWKQDWHLNGFDAGLHLGYRLLPLEFISLEPHAGLHWFELNHEDGADENHQGPDYRHMAGETRFLAGLSADWNWRGARRLGDRYDPSTFYLRATLDWLQDPMGSHRPELAGDGLAFYVSLGFLFKGMR